MSWRGFLSVKNSFKRFSGGGRIVILFTKILRDKEICRAKKAKVVLYTLVCSSEIS